MGHASVLLALTTALVTELAVPTGTLPTTGQLLRPPRSNPTNQTSLSCSRKPTSLPTTTHGTLTCTTVASAIRATVVQVALWWSAPRRLIPLMTSALPVPQSRTTSCNTTLPSEVQAGSRLTPTGQARQSQMTNKRTCPRVTTTVSTFWIPMAARFTVATALCLVKTALAVVSVTTPVAHASASADTLALLARRWKKWRNVMMTSVMFINLNIKY